MRGVRRGARVTVVVLPARAARAVGGARGRGGAREQAAAGDESESYAGHRLPDAAIGSRGV
jgi:hypothetical protein